MPSLASSTCVRRQAAELTFTYRFSFSNEPMIELAGLLREIAPMERAWGFFDSSGSESVESAIHLAILYWQHLGQPSKLELISRYPSYHRLDPRRARAVGVYAGDRRSS